MGSGGHRFREDGGTGVARTSEGVEADISKIEKLSAGYGGQGTLSLGDRVHTSVAADGTANAFAEAGPAPRPDPMSAVNVRLAGPSDADAIAGLSQELLAFYGLPSKHPRAYLGHMIQKHALVENSALEVLIATRRDRTLGFLAYSHYFAIAACRRSFFIQDIFVTRGNGPGVGRAMGALATSP